MACSLASGCTCRQGDAAALEQAAARQVGTADYRRVSIAGERAPMGVFDPSVEYDPGGRTGWMVYSALDGPAGERVAHNPKLVHTQLAKSADGGATWRFVERVNESTEGTIELAGRPVRGAWWHEVPSLLFDPGDARHPWKLYWMKYFAVPTPHFEPPFESDEPTVRIVQHMWIAYKGAPSPEQLDSAPEVMLFDAGQSERPAERALHQLNDLAPELADRKAYAEPGTLAHEGALYVSLDAFTGPRVEEHRLVLVTSADHGASWRYAGQLLAPSDAAAYGYALFGASSMAAEQGRIFLLVSPMDARGHHGTYVFEFEDLPRATLRRDGRGLPIVHKVLPPSVPTLAGHLNAGESSYHARNRGGGVLMPQSDAASAPAIGQIFTTGVRLVP